MAIISWLPGITVEICSADNKLSEYISNFPLASPSDEDDEVALHTFAKTEVFYVECIEAGFSIKYDVKAPFKPECARLAFEVYVDGKLCATTHLGRADYNKRLGCKWNYEVLGAERKETSRKDTVKRFRFTEIDTVSDASQKRIEAEKKKLSFAGDIQVKLYNTNYGTTLPPEEAKKVVSVPTKVSEVALKGKSVSHGTVYDTEKYTTKHQRHATKYKDGKDYPIAIFHFKYRSKEALQQEMIIPRDPSPARPSSPQSLREAVGDMGGLTAEQRAAIAKIIGFKEPARIKRERGADAHNSPSAAPVFKRRARPVLIDLSGDDDDDDEGSIAATRTLRPRASADGRAPYFPAPKRASQTMFVADSDDDEL